MGSHGQFRKMTPYEEAVRIPFLIGGEIPLDYGTRGCKAVKRVMINHVDIAPTTLGLCGIEKPVWMEGFDYSFCRLNRAKSTTKSRIPYISSRWRPTGDRTAWISRGVES